MKTTKISSTALLIFFLMPVLLLVTCHNHDDDDENIGNGYRMIKLINFQDDAIHDSTFFEYEGNKMSLARAFNADGASTQAQIDYPDANSIIMIESFNYAGSWIEAGKMIMKTDGIHVIEITDYELKDLNWEPYFKRNLSFENDKMVEFIEYRYESGTWVPDHKGVYEYHGIQYSQSTIYKYDGDWQPDGKVIYHYSDDKLDSAISYIYRDGLFQKQVNVVLNYVNNLLTEYTKYYYSQGTWIPGNTGKYTYDSYNNLETVTEQYVSNTKKTVYKYEKGSGNFSQFRNDYNSYGFFDEIFPHPVKACPGSRESIPIFFNFDKKIL